MSANIIDGKMIAQNLRHQIKEKIALRLQKNLLPPSLAVILVGDDPASHIYVGNKERAAKEVGIHSEIIRLSVDTTEKDLLALIEQYNQQKTIHGILVQLPLPKQINTQKIIEAISPWKDVDGFHPYNLGRLAQKNPTLSPCTPKGCIHLLESTKVPLAGKNAVIVGRSNIVGIPMMHELLAKNCTVTICHSQTKNLNWHVESADILIACVGKAHFIHGHWIKPGAMVIDVGINRLDNGKLVGDVEFESAKEKASFITPVPGGVGPMTIAMLLNNTLIAAELIEK